MNKLIIPAAPLNAGALGAVSLLWSGSGTATWSICLLSTGAALAMLQATQTDLVIGPLAGIFLIFLLLVGIHFVYARLRPEPRISTVSGGLAATIWVGFMAGVTALAALRNDAPLIDASLAHADELVGIDIPAFVAWVARHGLIGWILEIAYVSTVPLVFAAVMLLGWTNRGPRMWRTCFVFGGGATACAVISAFLPAIGSFAHYGISTDILAKLPNGAGLFHMIAFEGYRSGALRSVDVRHLEGVVTFPSFHAVMVLIIVYAFGDMRWLSSLILAWSSLILVSTVPIGGHYVIDLLAGVVVWAAFMLLSRLENSLRHAPPSRRAAAPTSQTS